MAGPECAIIGRVTDHDARNERATLEQAEQVEQTEQTEQAEQTESADAIFDALWGRVVEAWDEDKPHQAILDHALRSQGLPRLAGLYRSLADDPVKGPRAKKKMDGIVAAATQM